LYRTWYVGGSVTILYPENNPADSYLYHDLFAEIISPAAPKGVCSCCTHHTIEVETFVICPTCGHHTLKQPAADRRCRVCAWDVARNAPFEAARNVYIFGAYSDEALQPEQPKPFPEEVWSERYKPPLIWLVGFSSDEIWKLLVPVREHFMSNWQLLIALHPVYRVHSKPILWWQNYQPQSMSYLRWNNDLRTLFEPLDLTGEFVDRFCQILLAIGMPNLFLLDPAKLKLYDPIANWTYWCLLASDRHVIEIRFGQARRANL
jgi:hypothetical protein